MSFKLILEAQPIGGVALIKELGNMLMQFPGENIVICNKILHRHFKEVGLKTTIFTPMHYFKKHSFLFPGEKLPQ